MASKIDQTVKTAENKQLSYLRFMMELCEQESQHREQQAKERLLKTAQLPAKSSLDHYEVRDQNGLSL